MKGFTKEIFEKKANDVHDFKYNYDKVVYINSHTPVIITCPTHGDFSQLPYAHLCGKGCQHCANEGKKKLIYGVGINDYNKTIKINNRHILSYDVWRKMLSRCYDPQWHKRFPTYIPCSVCEEWKYFSNFKEWFDKNYIKGYDLDKDILKKGNKIYSPETCCFVPHEINLLLLKSEKVRGHTPIGVQECHYAHGVKYLAQMSERGIIKKIGIFNTSKEAFYAYKDRKEKYVQNIAFEYFSNGKITEKVYNALINYKVEITD